MIRILFLKDGGDEEEMMRGFGRGNGKGNGSGIKEKIWQTKFMKFFQN